MSKHTDQLVELAQPALVAGEEIVGAVRVNYNGSLPANTVSTDQAVYELAPDEAPPEAPDPDRVVAFPTAGQMGLVLTGGRLIVWSLGMSGKPKGWLGEVPLSAVDKVRRGDNVHPRLFRIVMKSGAMVDLELLRGEDPGTFVDELCALVGA